MIKYKKIILILLLIILTTITLNNSIVVATELTIDTEFYEPGDIARGDADRVVNIAGKILGAVRNCGIIISVIVIAIIGLKYMFCSLEEKANYKENMIPYVVGCFILMMATTIPSLVYDILN